METTSLIVTAVTGVVTAAVTAYVTANIKLRQLRDEWRHELKIKLAEASAEGREIEQALARQFAIGFVVVENGKGRDGREKVFIAPNSRITAGRSTSNAIVLDSKEASKQHFALVADESAVFVEDLGAANGVLVNERERVSGRRRLSDADVIRIGPCSVIYHPIFSGSS